MEVSDKENLLIPELEEETQSQSEEANEDKRDDKVDIDISYVREYINDLLAAGRITRRKTKTRGAPCQEN